MRPLALCILSLFVLAFSDPVTATDPASPTNPTSTGTSYITERTPQITGTLVSMTDHTLVVNTDDGERMSFEYDSRSLVPELPPGSLVKIEFHLMENGNYHAGRVVPIRTPSGEIAQGELRTSYEQDVEPEPVAVGTRTSSTYDDGHQAHATARTEVTAGTDADKGDAYAYQQQETGGAAATTSDDDTDGDDTLPRTASAQPLIGALGMLALASAVTLWALRRKV